MSSGGGGSSSSGGGGGGGQSYSPSAGPAGGASAGGNYGGNVNTSQSYGGSTPSNDNGGGGGQSYQPPAPVVTAPVAPVPVAPVVPDLPEPTNIYEKIAQDAAIEDANNQIIENIILNNIYDEVALTGGNIAPTPVSVEPTPTVTTPIVPPSILNPEPVAPTPVAPITVAPEQVAPITVAPEQVAPTPTAPPSILNPPAPIEPTPIEPTPVVPTAVAPPSILNPPAPDEPLDIEDFREIPVIDIPTVPLQNPQPVQTLPTAPPSILNPEPIVNDNTVDPGFQRALAEIAYQQQNPVYGDPDPYIDVPIEDRDTITSFWDNYKAELKSNPFNLSTMGALKTLYKTTQARNMMSGVPGYEFLGYTGGDRNTTNTAVGGGEQDYINNAISQLPFAMTGQVAPQSMVNQYFSNLNMGGQSNINTGGQYSLSSDLQTSYNNAKSSINNILGINQQSQQFGYSAQPYGSYSRTDLTNNPYYIDYLKQRGLI